MRTLTKAGFQKLILVSRKQIRVMKKTFVTCLAIVAVALMSGCVSHTTTTTTSEQPILPGKEMLPAAPMITK